MSKLLCLLFAFGGCVHLGDFSPKANGNGDSTGNPVLPGDNTPADCIDGCHNYQCNQGQSQVCYTGPNGTVGVGACQAGTQLCAANDRWGYCEGEVVPVPENCNDGIDNDCNGLVDCMDPACGASCCMPTDQTFSVSQTPADVLFIVDRSGSMGQPAGAVTKWDALRTAVDTVLPPLDLVLHMGLVIFPTDNDCSVPTTLPVPIAQPSAMTIANKLAAITSGGNTPTYQALGLAQQYFQQTPKVRERFIVLSTDGAPNCGADVNAVATRIAQIRTTLGIDTFVLGIPGNDTNLIAPLNQMADAGGRARSGAVHFYAAADTQSFQAALRGITAATSNCTYQLSQAPYDPNKVTVKFGQTAVGADPTNGWDYQDATHVRFNGAACDQIKSGLITTISVHTGC